MELYDTRTLAGVIRVQKPPELYWLPNFFKRTMTFDTQDILFDVVGPNKQLAPFVAPNVQGRPMRRQGFTSKSFRPAYAKPKHVLTPSATIPRLAGERIGGEYSRAQRYDAAVAENMRLENELLMRRFEWMAARAIIDASVTVVGDDYPPKTVDFGRAGSLSGSLTGAERWSQSTSTPLEDLEDFRRDSWDRANTPIDRITFGLEAWRYFSRHASVTPLLSTIIRGSDTNFNRAVADGQPWQYMGQLAGQGGMGMLDLYTYACTYQDDDLVAQPFMDQNTVVGTGSGIEGVRCFGAIEDFDAGLVATEMFPKMWRDDDPSVAYTMTQSAPLMVPAQPDGCFKILVHQ